MNTAPPSDPSGEGNWKDWIGRSLEQRDLIDVGRACALQASLDDPFPPLREGDALPPLWHWAFFWEMARSAELGGDGLAVGSGLLPPIDLPRIMWAGSRVAFAAPFVIGEVATRRSTIRDIVEKRGRSGRLCFVTLRHELLQKGVVCVEEEMDVVYREAAQTGESLGAGKPPPAEADWCREIVPSPVLLFRYSALTWNSHRIHYDRDYVTREEGYPGLIVHGPLLATLMLDQLRRQMPDARVTRFAFTAQRPVFDSGNFTVAGAAKSERAALWIADSDGFLAMDGSAAFDL